MGYIYQQGARPKGPESGIVLFHDPEYREQNINVEAAVAISEPLPGNDRIKVYDLPLVETMACVIYSGSFNQIGEGYKVIMDWIAANNYRITGPSREVYLEFNPDRDPSSFITEIQFPVEKA
jgi:effector-binding domain-containing protein